MAANNTSNAVTIKDCTSNTNAVTIQDATSNTNAVTIQDGSSNTNAVTIHDATNAVTSYHAMSNTNAVTTHEATNNPNAVTIQDASSNTKVVTIQDVEKLMQELDRVDIMTPANPVAERRIRDRIFAKFDGKDLASKKNLNELAKELQPKETGEEPEGFSFWTCGLFFAKEEPKPELTRYLNAWLKLMQKGELSNVPQERVACTDLCNPGAKSKCPNFLFGVKTAVMDKNKKFVACYEVERMIREMDINPEDCSRCILGAIMNGSIKITKKMIKSKDLSKVIFRGNGLCWRRGHKVPVKLSEVLFQNDNGEGKYGAKYAYEKPVIFCLACKDSGVVLEYEEDFDHSYFLTGMCQFEGWVEDEKEHNHCVKCPGYGMCYDKYRETHCTACGKHNFGPECYHDGCPEKVDPRAKKSRK